MNPETVNLTKAEACRFLNCSAKTLDRMLGTGELRSIKLGTGKSAPVRIPREWLLQDVGIVSKTQARRNRRTNDAEFHACMASLGGAK